MLFIQDATVPNGVLHAMQFLLEQTDRAREDKLMMLMDAVELAGYRRPLQPEVSLHLCFSVHFKCGNHGT